ncbi:MAG: cytochrome c maturation protein CcmE [Verrucomicrobiota bacterium]
MSGESPSAPAPVTRASAVKILASVVVVAGAVAYLLTSSMKQGAEYYKHVDEVMANADAWRGKRLQVHGNVVDGSIEQAKGTLTAENPLTVVPDGIMAKCPSKYDADKAAPAAPIAPGVAQKL